MRILQREYVSQWDRDVYNSAVKTELCGFMEFVALHFALSHRDDTEYWRDVMNRQYSKDIVEQIPSWHTGFVVAAFNKMRDYRFDSLSGIHCISTGLHWFPTDFPSLQSLNYNTDIDYWKAEWKSLINNMNKRKEYWASVAQQAPKLPDFLKTIHN